MNLTLYNDLGKTVKQFTLNSPTSNLDLKGLSTGLYFYIIKHQNEVLKSGKIIKE